MKKALLIVLVLVFQSIIPVRLLGQHFRALLPLDDATVHLDLYIKADQVLFSSSEFNAFEIPCSVEKKDEGQLHLVLNSDRWAYRYTLQKSASNWEGQLVVSAHDGSLQSDAYSLKFEPMAPHKSGNYVRKELSFNSRGNTLFGSLWQPEQGNGHAILMLTSSQGSDRSSGNALSATLAEKGYTVFNYDKCGTGKSEGDWRQSSIEELSDDDRAAVVLLATESELPINKISIVGSSQGGCKVPYLLSVMPALGGGISISCPGSSLLESDVNHWRNRHKGVLDGEELDLATAVQKLAFEVVAGKNSRATLEAILEEYREASWMQYVWIPEQDMAHDPRLLFDPMPYFGKVASRLLVIHGAADEVIPANSHHAIKLQMQKEQNSNGEFIRLADADHAMNVSTEQHPWFPMLQPDFVPTILNWLEN